MAHEVDATSSGARAFFGIETHFGKGVVMTKRSGLSRRQMMKMSAGTLLAASLWPGQLRAAEPETKPLKFIAVNDLHYTDDACAPFFEGLVKEWNGVEGAAFLLIAGDLVDTGTAAQCRALHDILAKLKIPYYVNTGNHDWATQTDRSAFEAVFGTKINFHMESNGWQFVGLDTSDGTKVEKFDVKKPTLDFVASLPSALDKSKPTFVYSHFPMGPGVNMRLQNADVLLEPFKQLNVAAIFNGHYHAYTQKSLGASIVTTNRCCSRKRTNHDNTFQKGYFVMDAADGKWTRTFMEYGTDFPGGAVPAGRRKPDPVPARPADKSAAWY
jgi:hypothetical protein